MPPRKQIRYLSSRRQALQSTGLALCLILLCAKQGHAYDSYARLPDDTSATLPPTPLSFEIKGSENFTYDSNPLLVPSGEKTLWGSTTSPEVIITDSTPDSRLSADTLLNENLYNRSEFDSTDLHETFKFVQQMSDWSAGLQARADYDTTRTSELTDFGLNLADVRHTGASVSPEIAYNITSNDKISLAGIAQLAHYDNSAFIDYDIFNVTPTYSHNFDPNNIGTLSFDLQRYQTTSGPSQTTDNFGPNLGWITTLSPTFKITLQAGAQESEQNGNVNTSENSEWNYVFLADLSYTGLQDTTHLIASRSQFPFANGVETLLDSFSVTETHNLNPNLALNVGGSYELSQDPPPTGINLDYEATGTIGLTYHLFEHLDVTSNYEYNQQSLTNVSGSIKENVVMFGLTYHPAMKAL